MERWACVDVPSLALQILHADQPEWRAHPVVVVDKDTAQGLVLAANRHARQFEVRPGMRYAAALSLHRDLRAAVVPAGRLAAAHERLTKHFYDHSPHVEPSTSEPGLFWLRATGLDKLFGSLEAWAQRLWDETRELGYQVSVSVGWTRFGTFATARADRVGWRIFPDADEETHHAGRVPLEMLAISPKPLQKLQKLGIYTVAHFLALPSSGVRKRFGEEAAALWKFANGAAELPLQPLDITDPVERSMSLDEPLIDSTRLIFILKSLLHPALLELAGRHQDLVELHVVLRLEDGDEREISVRPSVPTLEDVRILELARLKLENVSLPSGIIRLDIRADGAPYRREQQHLLRRNARRDPQAADHALARLQAEHGDHAVCRVTLQPRHLPEHSFALVPWSPSPQGTQRAGSPRSSSNQLVRRIYDRPIPLPRFDPEISRAWLIRDLDEGTVSRADGPYKLTDSWWEPDGFVARDYWFAHTTRGDAFWVYWDHLRRQWFLHGLVS